MPSDRITPSDITAPSDIITPSDNTAPFDNTAPSDPVDLPDPADEQPGDDGGPRPSRAHPLDLFSLVAGLLALVGAGLYLLGELTDLEVEPALVVAAAVVVLGLAGVVLALRRPRPT